MEFRIMQGIVGQPPLKFNFDELKEEIEQSLSKYGSDVTESSFKDAKADRARINKMIKYLKEKKTETKTALLAPMAQFATQIDELVCKCNNVVEGIDNGIKKIESERKARKRSNLLNVLTEYEVEEGISDQDILRSLIAFVDSNPQWLNATADDNEAFREIKAKVLGVVRDTQTIESTFADPKIRAVAMKKYKDTLMLGDAISEAQSIANAMSSAEEVQTPAPAHSAPSATANPQKYEITLAIKGTVAQLNALKSYMASMGLEYVQLGNAVAVK